MSVRAVPAHTIVRYRPTMIGFYASWQPVEAMRFRLFVNASHEEVTGDGCGGAPWVDNWSCETLSAECNAWRINGRNTWTTIDEAIKATSNETFATFDEALRVARQIAARHLDRHKRLMREAQWNLNEIDRAKPPVLPP